MTMQGFQQAMCDLVASPELCAQLVESADHVLGRYELSDRDRRRLVDVVQQRGMFVNCSLYRANRLSPIYNLMPRTCFLLGDALLDEVTEFWKDFDESSLQYNEEVEKFGDFLRQRIQMGVLKDPLIADALEYELALNWFRFTPRLELLSRLKANRVRAENSNRITLHPLIRVLLFSHEPARLLDLLDERQPPPYELAQGEFWLVLDGKGEEVEIKLVPPEVGHTLAAIEAGRELGLDTDDVEMLIEAGLTVRQ